MSKKEKYINYIVEDLLKKTEIDYDMGMIKPFSSFSSPHPLSSFFPFSLIFYYFSLYPFSKYMQEIYGAREEEVEIIWVRYRQRIHSLIENDE